MTLLTQNFDSSPLTPRRPPRSDRPRCGGRESNFQPSKGKTKADFFREEQKAVKPFQPGLFDDLMEG